MQEPEHMQEATGFYSNQNEHAVLMYKYGEQNYTEYYKKPVIKVHPGNLKISKAITGLEDNQEALQKVLQNLSFTCALTKPDGKTETKRTEVEYRRTGMECRKTTHTNIHLPI